MTAYEDIANAFGSVSQRSIREMLEGARSEQDKEFLEVHLMSQLCTMQDK